MNTNVANLTDFAVFVFLHINLEAETFRRHTIKGKQLLTIY